jgi:hypothetical protein
MPKAALIVSVEPCGHWVVVDDVFVGLFVVEFIAPPLCSTCNEPIEALTTVHDAYMKDEASTGGN